MAVTFWDTANVYQGGTSEEFVGRAVHKYSRREDVVVATKVHGRMHDGPGGGGLSRKAILEQLDESLRRLGTDYVDGLANQFALAILLRRPAGHGPSVEGHSGEP